jgi:ketosteroid isomerase-like protein
MSETDDLADLRLAMADMVENNRIEELLKRYCRTFDRRDLAGAIATHWDDCMVDYPGYVGPAVGMAEDADRMHGEFFDSTQHYVTNTLIERAGDTAHTETYFIMAARLKDSFGFIQVGGRYVRRVEKRDGEWRIAQCVCVIEWSSNPEAAATILGQGARAARDGMDYSCHRPLKVLREPFINSVF